MSKEYAEQLKESTKELLDGIGTDTEEEQHIIKLIYGFVRSGFFLKVGQGKAVCRHDSTQRTFEQGSRRGNF